MHLTAYVCRRMRDCAYITARVCGCVHMCINLYSHVSVHIRVRVHMRGCAHDECVST